MKRVGKRFLERADRGGLAVSVDRRHYVMKFVRKADRLRLAVTVDVGVNSDGFAEVLGIGYSPVGGRRFWNRFLRKRSQRRGWRGVKASWSSDAPQGYAFKSRRPRRC